MRLNIFNNTDKKKVLFISNSTGLDTKVVQAIADYLGVKAIMINGNTSELIKLIEGEK